MKKTLWLSVCLFLVITVGCATEPPSADQAQSAPAQGTVAEATVIVDHIIVGISDLEVGIEQLEALTGVRAVIGGEHPGRGTRNALISLGSGHYLELLAPVPGGVIDEFDDLAGDLETFSELTPLGWAASTSSMDALAQKLTAAGYEIDGPVPGSRVKPDGSVLEWKTLVITQPLLDGAPFFIEWGESSVHPSESSPEGCELATLQVGDPDAVELRGLAATLGLDIEVTAGDRMTLEFGLHCPNGEVHFSSDASGR